MDPGQQKAIFTASAFYNQPRGVGEVFCVVTGAPDPEWHHLDEAKPRRWHYLNIVPLDGSLNHLLDKRRFRYLPVQLQANALEARVHDHFRRGRFAQGYACARLGASLILPSRGDVELGKSPDPNRALDFCSSALVNLRPVSAVSFAIDTIQRSVKPILDSFAALERESLARVVIELGSYFRDYGLPRDATRCCDLAERLLANLDTLKARELKTRVMQHRGIAASAMGQVDLGHRLLDESYEAIQAQGSYVEGRGNYSLWKARFLLNTSNPDVDRCRALVQDVYRLQERRQVSVWTYAEAVWTDAEAHLTGGRKVRAYDAVARGDDLFRAAGIVPTAIMAPRSVRRFREKYPNNLYAVPRRAKTLGDLVELARSAVGAIENNIRAG